MFGGVLPFLHIVHEQDYIQFSILESNVNRLSPNSTQLVCQKKYVGGEGSVPPLFFFQNSTGL